MASFGNDVLKTGIPAGTVATATANSATVIDTVNKGTMRLASIVTAASGTTPSLTVKVQTSNDAGVTDAWRDVTNGALTAQTAAGTVRGSFSGLDRYCRIVSTISGTTPSFTYGVFAEVV